jgi:stearoyl-CoA 9-desaturase NADPH oxidoreductase
MMTSLVYNRPLTCFQTMPVATATRRLLRSPLIDVLLGPHGIDRYLELIRPEITVRDARARVVSVVRTTPRSATLTLKPNSAWSGFQAGQFVKVGLEIDGIRRSRTYSPACSQHATDGLLELTVTLHPDGLVSRHLQRDATTGAILHLGEAQGDFVLPDPRPQRLVLISGGSGITPVMSMLRTLCDEGHDGEVLFVHYARTAADWLYRGEVQALARTRPNTTSQYVATREGGERLDAAAIKRLVGEIDDVHAAVCGPPALIEAVREIWGGKRVLAESFTPPALAVTGAAASGTLRFARSERAAPLADGTLLEQAEAAGLSPEFGCRMGICHTCTCRKLAGGVQNILTGEVSEEEDEDIQLCVSVPTGDLILDI